MGKSTISMAIFNSFLDVYQRVLVSSILIFFHIDTVKPHRPHLKMMITAPGLFSNLSFCFKLQIAQLSSITTPKIIRPEPGMLTLHRHSFGSFFVAPRLLGRELPKKAHRSELHSFGECCAPIVGRQVGTIPASREIYLRKNVYINVYYIYKYNNMYMYIYIYVTYSWDNYNDVLNRLKNNNHENNNNYIWWHYQIIGTICICS